MESNTPNSLELHKSKENKSSQARWSTSDSGTRIIEFREVFDNLKNFIPEWQLLFVHYPLYKELCISLHDWLIHGTSEEKMKFDYFIILWNEFCEKDPESIREKERINKRKENRRREENFNELYVKHIQALKKELI